MEFYLGTHQPHWLARYDAPMMVSRRALARYKTRPRARAPWFQDSGGFTELSMFGRWETTAEAYVAETRRNAEEVGMLERCAPQDWMCEPMILAKTGKTVRDHQRLTVENYSALRSLAPELPWVPVLQGWGLDDYLRCADLYDRAGVALAALPLVGVGTICRRQGTKEAAMILSRLAAEGLRLHAFGLKGTGIPNVAPFLASSDSLAWSYAARRQPPLDGCTTHKNCANCPKFAFLWLARIEQQIKEYRYAAYQTAMAI